MSKQEFLGALYNGLSGLPKEDIENSVQFYSEMIDDRMDEGMTENEAVEDIGSVNEIIQQILSESSLPKLVKRTVSTSDFVTHTYTVEDDFTNIIIEDAESNINFYKSNDDKCRVLCDEREKVTHTVVNLTYNKTNITRRR